MDQAINPQVFWQAPIDRLRKRQTDVHTKV